MSDGRNSAQRAPAPGAGPGGHGRGGPMGGGPMGGFGRVVEKPKNFKGSLRRLLRYLTPHMGSLVVVFLLAILSTLFAMFAPRVMGNATTKIFEGFRTMMTHAPGAGIDFGFIGRIVVLLIGLYTVSSLFMYLQQFIMAGVAQKTVYNMRRDVKEKLTRLPLKFYDGRTHGEIMSRFTNDMDNIATTLQQSLTQLITSAVTIIGVIIMMLTISPLLTLITIVVLPLSFVMTRIVAPRSQNTSRNSGSTWDHSTATWRRCTRVTASSRRSAANADQSRSSMRQ